MLRSCKTWALLFLAPAFLQAQTTDSTRNTALAPERLKSFSQVKLPAALILGGIALNTRPVLFVKKEIAEERNEHMPRFKTKIDNYLQYSPLVIAYGLDAFGVPSRTDLLNRSAILIKGEALMVGTVFFLKNHTGQLRPDGSDYESFPSGHTAQAFAAATFLSEEYKHRFKWMPYAAYGLASTVGVLRMANNRHYVTDVLLGAGIGTLMMKVSYWTHQYKWGRQRQALPVW
jgi:membrane-associated phospholipid phosphatase